MDPFYGWFCVKFEHILVKREKASAALKSMIRDAAAHQHRSRGRHLPEGTRTVPGAPPDYKSGYVALYEALGVEAVPLALNSGLFWPRWSPWRYPGTIVVEFLPPLAPGLPRAAFRARIEAAIEDASSRLIAEAAASADPPPLAGAADRLKRN
jgi:1-acyl-sn-glycerol-3-phosphate acyltransferase